MVYKIKFVSQTNAIALIVVLLAFFLGGAFIFIPQGLPEGLAYLLASLVAMIAYVLWQRFVTGRTEWTVDDNEIAIVWTKRFVLANSKDLHLKWTDIKNISKGLDPQYYNLKIKLSTGETIKFYHDTLTTRDDFKDLIKVLYQTLNDKKTTGNTGSAYNGKEN